MMEQKELYYKFNENRDEAIVINPITKEPRPLDNLF